VAGVEDTSVIHTAVSEGPRVIIGQPAGREPAPPPLDLVQDFVNTEIPEWHVDELATPALLGAWLARRSLLDDGEAVDADEFLLARDVRALLRQLTVANAAGTTALDEGEGLHATLARVPLRLGVRSDGGPALLPAGEGVQRALGALLVVVLDAERDGTWPRMKACRMESCGWLFYDRSRNRSGNWCSMTICGNRSKTRRYRERRAVE
jgi:predicted RNA-binding Zn ribbon-like protein